MVSLSKSHAPDFVNRFRSKRRLEFLLCLGTHRPCREIGQHIIRFYYPASAAEHNAPDQQVPEKIEPQRDIRSSSLRKQ